MPSYYNAYLDYFHRVVLAPGVTTSIVLEKYLFSSHYNVRTPKQGAEQPQMLNRFLEILIHPIIHAGYGAEFGIPGLIAEGAWSETAVWFLRARADWRAFDQKVSHGRRCILLVQPHSSRVCSSRLRVRPPSLIWRSKVSCVIALFFLFDSVIYRAGMDAQARITSAGAEHFVTHAP